MKTSGITSGKEWQRVVFWTREEPTTKHPEENSLNLEEDLEEGLLK